MSDRSSAIRRARPRKQLVMFVLSLALGGIGVFYSKHYIDERIAYYRAQLAGNEEMIDIIVPKQPLVRGQVLVREMLGTHRIPKRYADSHHVSLSRLEVAVGQRIAFDIDAGKTLLWAHLEGGLSPTFSGKVPEGLRAMTVRVDEINSISGFLQPKDRVDLLMTHGSGDRQQIVPLIERLDVIATGTQTLVDKTANGTKRSFTTITVQVSPHQAQQITLAQGIGKLTAMLRNPDDEAPLGPVGMTVAELLGLDSEPATPIVKRPVRRRPPPPAIEYIIGGRP